jgi:hypothetical protein
MDYMGLVRRRDKWQTLVHAAMNHLVQKSSGEILD